MRTYIQITLIFFNQNFRPPDRCGFDLDVIYTRLKRVKAFRRFHPLMLQQVAYFGFYEQLDAGVTCK